MSTSVSSYLSYSLVIVHLLGPKSRSCPTEVSVTDSTSKELMTESIQRIGENC